jgi:tetratricopeptide (TPR) repeat protein
MPAPEPEPPPGNPREQAEYLLAAARKAGDTRAEATALADLGVACLRSGDKAGAVSHLEQAYGIARGLGDRARECDVLAHLGLAMLAASQPARALQLLEVGLQYARETRARFPEKLVLEHLGILFTSMADYPRAVAAFEQALALARELNDRPHQADLLWYLAIAQAELGRRDQAAELAQAAVDLHRALGTPSAGWLADHLEKFRSGKYASGLAAGTGAMSGTPEGTFFGWSAGMVTAAQPVSSGRPDATSGPGLLRMAMSGAKSMAKFVGSGLKTLPPTARQKRLRVCMTCEHHTGVRCKLCGCFTSAKTWLPHEQCPIGKWPA